MSVIFVSCPSLFDGKFNSGRILWISREQQDMQSFVDGAYNMNYYNYITV